MSIRKMVPDTKNRVSFFITLKLYKYKYKFRKTFAFCNNYVRKMCIRDSGIVVRRMEELRSFFYAQN